MAKTSHEERRMEAPSRSSWKRGGDLRLPHEALITLQPTLDEVSRLPLRTGGRLEPYNLECDGAIGTTKRLNNRLTHLELMAHVTAPAGFVSGMGTPSHSRSSRRAAK